jgi:ABC-2 type transport system permease protein
LLFILPFFALCLLITSLAHLHAQSIHMAFFIVLPQILLSGFMFPFAGMPVWAQWIGEFLPLTHYLRIVRAIMLKGATLDVLSYDTLFMAALMLIAMVIAVTRFRRTLD